MATDDILDAIDDAVRANLCGCGCGQQIPARGPSPDFVNEKHQRVWDERRTSAAPAWIGAARAQIEARNDMAEDCDDTNCPCHGTRFRHCHGTPFRNPDETPMARIVRETSSLRKAIDKIMGKAR